MSKNLTKELIKQANYKPKTAESKTQNTNKKSSIIINATIKKWDMSKVKEEKEKIEISKEEKKMKSNLIKGKRLFCDCEGLKHLVLINCLECGKIICEQEGF
jgi:hypothetical protein